MERPVLFLQRHRHEKRRTINIFFHLNIFFESPLMLWIGAISGGGRSGITSEENIEIKEEQENENDWDLRARFEFWYSLRTTS